MKTILASVALLPACVATATPALTAPQTFSGYDVGTGSVLTHCQVV